MIVSRVELREAFLTPLSVAERHAVVVVHLAPPVAAGKEGWVVRAGFTDLEDAARQVPPEDDHTASEAWALTVDGKGSIVAAAHHYEREGMHLLPRKGMNPAELLLPAELVAFALSLSKRLSSYVELGIYPRPMTMKEFPNA